MLALSVCVQAGEVITQPDGVTIVRVVMPSHMLPNPSIQDTSTRALMAVNKSFVAYYKRIFADRLRAKYEADPATYGHRDWSNVTVELRAFSGIRVEGVETDLLAIAGGMSPDILSLNFRKSDSYIRRGFLYPLDRPQDDYASAESEKAMAWRIKSRIWPVVFRKGPGGKEHLWALPYGGAGGKVLVFRKDLFDRYGVAYPTADWTWDDLLAAARKLTDPEAGIYGTTAAADKHESYWWMTYLWSAGGEAMVFDKETDEWKCVFDSREAAVALDFYTRLCTERWTDDKGKVRRGFAYKSTWGAVHEKWKRGEIAMMFDGIGANLFSTIDPEVTGMVPVPLGPTGLRHSELNSGLVGLFSEIKDPVVRDAAWEYIWYQGSKEAMAIKVRVMVEGGLGQFVHPDLLRMFGYDDVIRLAPKGWKENYEIAIATGKPEPYGKNSNLAYSMMTIPLQQAEQLAVSDQLPEDREARLDMLQELLRQANARANEEMIGTITPEERRKRDITAAIVLILLVIAFGYVFHRTFKAFRPPQGAVDDCAAGTKRGFRRYRWAYLLMLPAVLSILIWRYVPLAHGSLMAFQDYNLLGDSTWVGLQNFGDLIYDNLWWRSVYDALRYSMLVVCLTFIPPIILAILLQEIPRGTLMFRTIYYLPAVITGLVMIVLWKQFYEPSDQGVLNSLVMSIPAWGFLLGGVLIALVPLFFARRLFHHRAYGMAALCGLVAVLLCGTAWSLAGSALILPGETVFQALPHMLGRIVNYTPEPYRWLRDPNRAMLACVLPMVWAGMGPGCLIYLAALKGIPDDYYEAASIDGATFIDKILFVVIPILKPLIIINFIGVFINSWYGATGNILAMTGGQANTEVAGLYIFYKAFMFLKFGPATAAAWVLAFMLIGFTIHQLRILSRLEFRTTGSSRKS